MRERTQHYVLGLTWACLAAALLSPYVPAAAAQSVATQSQTGAVGGSGTRPSEDQECVGMAWSPFWDDAVYLTIAMYANNNSVVSPQTFFGSGDASGTLNASVELDKQPISMICDGTFWSTWGFNGSDTASWSTGFRYPDDVFNLQLYETFSFADAGDYVRSRKYSVRDQHGFDWDYSDTLTEDADLHEDTCTGNTNITTTPAGVTLVDSLFNDDYSITGAVNACTGDPNCYVRLTQYYYVHGQSFSHGVRFGCTDVEIGR